MPKEEMMRKTAVVSILISMFVLLTGCAQNQFGVTQSAYSPVLDRIKQRGELVLGTAGSMPPMNMTNKNDKVIGFEIDLARYLADSLGVKLKVEKMQFSELLSALKSGKVDMVMSGMTMTVARNSEFAFVGPYFISGKGILTNKANLSSISDPNQIDRKDIKITALKGSTSQEFVEKVLPKATLVPAKDYDEAVAMVLDGKVDAMLADHPICLVSVVRYPESDLFTIVAPFTYEAIGAALPPNDPLFVNLVQNFFNTLEGSGALDNLIDYWVEDPEWINQMK
jgi:polar amino acid transport system substrate-binding protein